MMEAALELCDGAPVPPQVVFSVPSDVTDVEVVIEGLEQEQDLPALVAVAQDQSDNSVTSLYDADFSGMYPELCVGAVSGCLRTIIVFAHVATWCTALTLGSGAVGLISCVQQGYKCITHSLTLLKWSRCCAA